MNPERKGRPTIASFGELMGYLREDYEAHSLPKRNWTFWTAGFQALAAYRLGVWCNGLRWRLLRSPIRLLVGFHSFFARNFYGVEIYPSASIGRRVKIAHQHGIIIHYAAVIGDDCLIHQGVTIGTSGSSVELAPQIGRRVMIGAGAIVAGAIVVGDDVKIGPNAVVMSNVPAGSIVASPQSRIMSPPPRRHATDAVAAMAPGDARPEHERMSS